MSCTKIYTIVLVLVLVIINLLVHDFFFGMGSTTSGSVLIGKNIEGSFVSKKDNTITIFENTDHGPKELCKFQLSKDTHYLIIGTTN